MPYSFMGHVTLFILNMEARNISIMDPMPIPTEFKGKPRSLWWNIANNVNLAMELINPKWNDNIFIYGEIYCQHGFQELETGNCFTCTILLVLPRQVCGGVHRWYSGILQKWSRTWRAPKASATETQRTKEVSFLWHIISNSGVIVDPKKS